MSNISAHAQSTAWDTLSLGPDCRDPNFTPAVMRAALKRWSDPSLQGRNRPRQLLRSYGPPSPRCIIAAAGLSQNQKKSPIEALTVGAPHRKSQCVLFMIEYKYFTFEFWWQCCHDLILLLSAFNVNLIRTWGPPPNPPVLTWSGLAAQPRLPRALRKSLQSGPCFGQRRLRDRLRRCT